MLLLQGGSVWGLADDGDDDDGEDDNDNDGILWFCGFVC